MKKVTIVHSIRLTVKVLLGLIILLGVICLLVQSFILCVIHE